MAPTIATGRQAGFSYIIMLMFVAVSGAAMGVVSEFWWLTRQREKEAELLFVGDQFRQAIERYHTTGRYPKTLQAMLGETKGEGKEAVTKRYLRQLYLDPITNTSNWGTVTTISGEIVGVYSQSKDTPIKQAGFSSANKSFEKAKYYSDWVFLAKGAPVAGANAPGTAPAGQGAQSFKNKPFSFR